MWSLDTKRRLEFVNITEPLTAEIRDSMARTVIYPQRRISEQRSGGEPIFFGGRGPNDTGSAHPAEQVAADGYADKLTKFIPAETVAFFAPTASLLAERAPLLITAGVIGLLATPAYLWSVARKLAPEQRPRWHYYALSTIAFLVWAIATSRLGGLLGLDSVATAFMLGATVFLIPLVDSLLTTP